MRIKLEDLECYLEYIWASITTDENARNIAQNIVKTHIRQDERIDAVNECLDDYEKCLSLENLEPSLISASGGIKVYDFNRAPGILHLSMINQEVIALAKAFGVSSIGIRNTGGVHTLENWVSALAEQDCIGLFAWNGGAFCVVPFGSAEPFWGTNPIAYAIPTLDLPIIADMSTSDIPFMNLINAIVNGRELGFRQGLDSEGKPTTDPNEVYDMITDGDCRLLPLGGGYKGSAIVLLIEILTGALVGGVMGREAQSNAPTSDFGGVLFCVNINAFTNVDEFKSRVTNMANQIRLSKHEYGVQVTYLPGDKSNVREKKALLEGYITLNKKTYDRLINIVNRK